MGAGGKSEKDGRFATGSFFAAGAGAGFGAGFAAGVGAGFGAAFAAGLGAVKAERKLPTGDSFLGAAFLTGLGGAALKARLGAGAGATAGG